LLVAGLNLHKGYNNHKMIKAGAELCQAQFKLGLANTAFPDDDIGFVFPVLKILSCLPFPNN
jgi:hypothetical protein